MGNFHITKGLLFPPQEADKKLIGARPDACTYSISDQKLSLQRHMRMI